jgi:hypothetical protein
MEVRLNFRDVNGRPLASTDPAPVPEQVGHLTPCVRLKDAEGYLMQHKPQPSGNYYYIDVEVI